MGITPAPAAINRTRAENLTAQYLAERMPKGALSQEQAARRDSMRQLSQDLREGRPIQDEATQALREGKIGTKDLSTIRKRLMQNRLVEGAKRLALAEITDVYRVASSEERILLKPVVTRKIALALPQPYNLTPEVAERLRGLGFSVPVKR